MRCWVLVIQLHANFACNLSIKRSLFSNIKKLLTFFSFIYLKKIAKLLSFKFHPSFSQTSLLFSSPIRFHNLISLKYSKSTLALVEACKLLFYSLLFILMFFKLRKNQFKINCQFFKVDLFLEENGTMLVW